MAQVHAPIKKALTAGQIGKIQELLGASLRKEERFDSEVFQKMLENDGKALVQWLLAAVHAQYESSRLEHQSDDWVTVSDKNHMVANVPWVGGGRKEFHFLMISDGDRDWQKAYERHGLTSPTEEDYELLNKAGPFFSKEYPNFTPVWRFGGWGSASVGARHKGANKPLDSLITNRYWLVGVPQ